jgi:hypothetical protein
MFFRNPKTNAIFVYLIHNIIMYTTRASRPLRKIAFTVSYLLRRNMQHISSSLYNNNLVLCNTRHVLFAFLSYIISRICMCVCSAVYIDTRLGVRRGSIRYGCIHVYVTTHVTARTIRRHNTTINI